MRWLRRRVKAAVNAVLHRWDTRGTAAAPMAYPPVFIVGAPRSGSTLLMQLLASGLEIGYMSNAHCRWHSAPAMFERRNHPATDGPDSAFESRYGRTDGSAGPAECGDYWYRFFPRSPHYAREVDATTQRRLRSSLGRFGDAWQRPTVWKNLYCSLRLRPIAAAVPEALFIVISRDLADNARSLLAGRMKMHNAYDTWFSAEPPNVDELRHLPPADQVVQQVRSVLSTIDADARVIGRDRFVEISYEDVCARPADAVNQIATFMQQHGIDVTPRAGFSPEPFHPRHGSTLDDNMEALLATAIEHADARDDASARESAP